MRTRDRTHLGNERVAAEHTGFAVVILEAFDYILTGHQLRNVGNHSYLKILIFKVMYLYPAFRARSHIDVHTGRRGVRYHIEDELFIVGVVDSAVWNIKAGYLRKFSRNYSRLGFFIVSYFSISVCFFNKTVAAVNAFAHLIEQYSKQNSCSGSRKRSQSN